MEEKQILVEIAEKVEEMFSCEDLWIDGICGGTRSMELHKLIEKWRSEHPKEE